MTRIEVKGLYKAYTKNEYAVNDVSFVVEDGQSLAIVGPSGSGKSTLLRMIAGLESISQGKIYFDGVDVTVLDASKRNVAMIFQDAALFPHTKVKDNITYGLVKLGYNKQEIEAMLMDTARLLHIEHLLNRYPNSLSGGEAQRVDIARAIIRKPSILLLDEPLSSLDASLRSMMRKEIMGLQKKFHTTMITVSHDQLDAMTMGQNIAVMKDGCMLCLDDPDTLYDYPPDPFTASFIGVPPMNLMDGMIETVNQQSMLTLFHQRIALHAMYDEGSVIVGIRPELIHIEKDGMFEGIITSMRRDGNLYVFECMVEDCIVLVTTMHKYKLNDTIRFNFKVDDLRLFIKENTDCKL